MRTVLTLKQNRKIYVTIYMHIDIWRGRERKEKRKKERGRGRTNPERRQTLICRQKKIPLANQDLIFQSWMGQKQERLLPSLYPRAALNRLPP